MTGERAIVHIAATIDKAICGEPMTQRDWAAEPATAGPVDTCPECRAGFAQHRRHRP